MNLTIRSYRYDDEELILLLRHHFGSDTHFREHKQHFYRNPQKTFFVAINETGEVCGYCSLHRREIKDLTTLRDFRGKGVATALIHSVLVDQHVVTIGTSNDKLSKLVKRMAFRYRLNRGQYAYYIWERSND